MKVRVKFEELDRRFIVVWVVVVEEVMVMEVLKFSVEGSWKESWEVM